MLSIMDFVYYTSVCLPYLCYLFSSFASVRLARTVLRVLCVCVCVWERERERERERNSKEALAMILYSMR